MEWYKEGKSAVLGATPVSIPRCPPQSPHKLAYNQTQASAVTGSWPTAWVMAWPAALTQDTQVQITHHKLKCTANTKSQFKMSL